MEGEGCAPPPTTAKKSRNANCFRFTKDKSGFECRRYKYSNFIKKAFLLKTLNSFLWRVQPQEWWICIFPFFLIYFIFLPRSTKQITPNAQLISVLIFLQASFFSIIAIGPYTETIDLLFEPFFAQEKRRVIEWLREIKTADQHCYKFIINTAK